MSCDVKKFGSATVARVRSSADLKNLLKDPLLRAETVIIKPNWVGIDREYGFTESGDLRMLLEGLDSNIVVTESYNLGRRPQDSDMKFIADGKELAGVGSLRGRVGSGLRSARAGTGSEKESTGTASESMTNGSSTSTVLLISSMSTVSNMSVSLRSFGKDGMQTRKKSRRFWKRGSLLLSMKSCIAFCLRSCTNCEAPLSSVSQR